MKQERGITLIALVITIIVLLILAGVSIAMLTGENGLLSRSKSAVIESKIADCKEYVMLTVNELISEYYELKYVGPDNTRPSEPTPEAYVAAKLSGKLTDTKYVKSATASDNIILAEINKDGKEIKGAYSTTDGQITWTPVEPTV